MAAESGSIMMRAMSLVATHESAAVVSTRASARGPRSAKPCDDGAGRPVESAHEPQRARHGQHAEQASKCLPIEIPQISLVGGTARAEAAAATAATTSTACSRRKEAGVVAEIRKGRSFSKQDSARSVPQRRTNKERRYRDEQ